MTSFFQTLTSDDMAALFDRAEHTICYAGPGIQCRAANALVAAASRIGADLITVCLDFDERVLRMGFGDVRAVRALKDAGIKLTTTPGLRMGIAVADEVGFSFTPTALLLEAEDRATQAMNAMRLSPDQAKEALARLSPAAKAVAIVLAKTEAERQRLSAIEVEVSSSPVDEASIKQVEKHIDTTPVANFDVARQVRVYSARLQYVELHLRNAAIERRRIAIPQSIQKLGASDMLEGRLKTTFDLIEKNSTLSSKRLADEVANLRLAYTPSLGRKLGRAILKSAKPNFEERLKGLHCELAAHQVNVEKNLQEQLDKSRREIVDHYSPLAQANPPDVVRGLFGGNVEAWLEHELEKVFPRADELVHEMTLDVEYKDVTFETLQKKTSYKQYAPHFPEEIGKERTTSFGLREQFRALMTSPVRDVCSDRAD